MRKFLLPAFLASIFGLAYMPTQAQASWLSESLRHTSVAIAIPPVYAAPYCPPPAPVYAPPVYPQTSLYVAPAPTCAPAITIAPPLPRYYVAPRHYVHPHHHYH